MTKVGCHPIQGIFLSPPNQSFVKYLRKVSEVSFSLQSAIVGQEDNLRATKYNFRPKARIMSATLPNH